MSYTFYKMNEVLNNLMEEKGLGVVAFSREVNIPYNNISDYTSGRAYPSFDNTIKIAKYFNVSVGYLFDLTENKNVEKTCNKPFYEIYLKLLEDNNTNNYRFCRDNGIDVRANRRWRVGIMPSMKNLIKISYAFVINIDYLIGDKHYIQINEKK